MKKIKLFILMISLALLSGIIVSCSDGDDGNEEQKTEYTVTLYTEFGSNPTIIKIESEKTLGANMAPAKDGYDFKGWFSADGTDYTSKAIMGDVTLFAYFIKTTTEGAGTAIVTTTTNEVGADSYESEKKVTETTNDNGTKVTVTEESSSKTNTDGTKTEIESKTTENFDGTNTTVTSEKTVTTKDADGNTTSKVETTVTADGTTTVKTTDAEGKTTTETTGGNGNTDSGANILADLRYKSTELKMNGESAPSGVSETIAFADGGTCTLTGYYNASGTYTVTGTSITVIFTSGDIIGTMTGTLSNENTTITAQGTVTISGKSVVLYGVYAKQDTSGGTENQSTEVVSANADGSYTVTPYNISATLAAIAEKGDTEATLIVINATNDLISKIPEALKANSGVLVNLDLSKSTELTSLPNSAFKNCTSLKKIVLPDNVSLGEKCFQDCTSLTSINIPEGITTIPKSCFSDCTSLTSITIPDGVEFVEERAFSACYFLSKISIPSSIQEFYTGAFSSCNNLTTVDFRGTLEQWCAISFTGGWSSNYESANPVTFAKSLKINGETLTNAVIPDTVTKINSYAFYNCESLTSVTMSDSVTSVGGYAFVGCTGLENIILSQNLTEIGTYAFKNCSSLSGTIVIPDGVTEIPNQAFYNCKKLEGITLGNKVTNIGNSAFSDCSALENINLPETLTSISRAAFANCSSLAGTVIIPNGITVIEPDTFKSCKNIAGVNIPSSVVTIGENAFMYCDSISNLEIPDSVTTIGDTAFMGSSDKTSAKSLTSVTIGSGVTRIGRLAFSNQSNLTTATFADSESTWYFYSAPQVVPNYDYTGGTEIGKFSASDTAENATKLKNTYTSGYLYNSNYSAN